MSESELILNRAGMFGVDDRELETMTICPSIARTSLSIGRGVKDRFAATQPTED